MSAKSAERRDEFRWLFQPDELRARKEAAMARANSPFTYEEEAEMVHYACTLLDWTAASLKLPASTVFIANTYLQRFFSSHSIVQTKYDVALLACLLLASKTDDVPVKVSDILRAAKMPGLKNEVINFELVLLADMKFDVQVAFPLDVNVLRFCAKKESYAKTVRMAALKYAKLASFSDVVLTTHPKSLMLVVLKCAAEDLIATGEKEEMEGPPAKTVKREIEEGEVTEVEPPKSEVGHFLLAEMGKVLASLGPEKTEKFENVKNRIVSTPAKANTDAITALARRISAHWAQRPVAATPSPPV